MEMKFAGVIDRGDLEGINNKRMEWAGGQPVSCRKIEKLKRTINLKISFYIVYQSCKIVRR